ncbi:MAG: uracil-DNA glycosylase [Actinomycetota bacterium]|nr:uracil-DNA glycosylase [Actinomycetota bacterium]
MPQLSGDRVEIESVRSRALSCTRCRLSESRTQVVWAGGNLDSDVMLIGEGPGFHEDREGEPFVGASGQLLDRLLAEVGLDRSSVAIVNVVKCRPPGNRDPLPDEIDACRPYLEAQLEYMRPDVIVTLGNFATRFMIGEPIGITRARGRLFRYRGATVVPTFHPAAALRGGSDRGIPRIDAIRQDLATVKVLVQQARSRHVAHAPQPASAHQLGLFE